MGSTVRTLITNSRSAATAFLVLIGLYVLCIIAVQINWSSTNAFTFSTTRSIISEQSCNGDDDQCMAKSPSSGGGGGTGNEGHQGADISHLEFSRRLFVSLMGFGDDDNNNKKGSGEVTTRNDTAWNGTHRNHTIAAEFDPADCYLTRKLDITGMPIIHSIFVDSITHDVVVTGVLRRFFDSWHAENFHCIFQINEFDYIATMSDPIVQDYKRFGEEAQYSVVITCPLPKQMYGRRYFKMSFRRASNPKLGYDNITVCEAVAPTSPKHFLTMCTMTKDMDRYIPDWLNYHKLVGVEHAVIYDNSPKSTLPKSMRKFVESGFLTIIPWAHQHTPSKTYLEVQVASENDCMWRYKHTSHWMIKIDVDEFLQPMDPTRLTIPEYLNNSRFQLDHLGSVRIQNWFFCRHKQLNYGLKSLHSIRSVFERNLVRNLKPSPINRGRDKAIARPENVHYYKIHGVKLGGDTLSLSPHNEIRLAHYRGDNPRHIGFCSGKDVADFSMIRQWYRLHGANVTELNGDLAIMLEMMKDSGSGRKMHSYYESSSLPPSTSRTLG